MGSGKADAETSRLNCGLSCILLIMGIIQIAIGASYVRDCKVDNSSPKFLIVSGCISVFFALFWRHEPNCCIYIRGFGIIVGLVWLIIGSHDMFSNWQKYNNPQCNPDDECCKTCNKVLFYTYAGMNFFEMACALLFFCYLCYKGIRCICTC